MPPTIHTRNAYPTEPSSWRRIRPGVRKTPEPITEPMKRRKRSRCRMVRIREARGAAGASVLVGRIAAILVGEECLRCRVGSMGSLHEQTRLTENFCYSRNGAGMKLRTKTTKERKAAPRRREPSGSGLEMGRVRRK